MEKLFPGQVTAVFTRKNTLNQNLNPGTSLIGIRIPNHHFIRQLVKCCPFPLALTSANKSGNPSTLEIKVILCTCSEMIISIHFFYKEFQELWHMLNAIIDGGKIHNEEFLGCRKGSTVINFSVKGYYQVFRQGRY